MTKDAAEVKVDLPQWRGPRTTKETQIDWTEAPLGPEDLALIARALADARGTVDVFQTIESLVADIDGQISLQLNCIMRAPEFRRIEAAWRGLHYLVRNTDPDMQLGIKVLNVARDELCTHVGVMPWDRNTLFRVVHDETFGTPDGVPYAILVGDFEFAHEPEDLQLLQTIGEIAMAIHAPFIAGASPRLFGAESWVEFAAARAPLERLDDQDHEGWKTLRDKDGSRFLALCLPRLLARAPYGARNDPVDEFAYEEDTDAPSARNAVWINAAYALAVNLNRAQSVHGWCARFLGSESGGRVEDLPYYVVRDDDGQPVVGSPIEAVIDEKRDMDLSRAGLIPVLHRKNTNRGIFFAASSLFRPRRFEGDNAVISTARDHLSARLPYRFPVYRFAHYLRVLIRGKIGRFDDPAALSRELQAWLDSYIHADFLHANEADLARQPLASGRIEIVPDEDRPGLYRAILVLRPYFQNEGIDVELPLDWPLPDLLLRSHGREV